MPSVKCIVAYKKKRDQYDLAINLSAMKINIVHPSCLYDNQYYNLPHLKGIMNRWENLRLN